ncbi:hypothetical protein CP533_6327 [Ophiocordyceps camponoti-saundersi (nom. inval.)]|nr:hypothetical protein CP533_6327 [Ophiocordyceps camponoti-saundersi (nom. inval.)]
MTGDGGRDNTMTGDRRQYGEMTVAAIRTGFLTGAIPSVGIVTAHLPPFLLPSTLLSTSSRIIRRLFASDILVSVLLSGGRLIVAYGRSLVRVFREARFDLLHDVVGLLLEVIAHVVQFIRVGF